MTEKQQGAHPMPHTFQSFWSGPPLSLYERLCLKSFLDHGHRFALYSFDASIAVPDGVELRDARDILDPSEYFVYRNGFGKGSPAAFANLFRYELLSRLGGWWVDADVVCLSPDIPLVKMFYAKQHDGQFNNAVLHFPPWHPVMLRCLAETRRIGRNVVWGQTGPALLTAVMGQICAGREIAPTRLAYPVPVGNALAVLRPERTQWVMELTRPSWFLHLWNEVLKARHVDKNSRPPAGSFLESLFVRHGFG